VVISTVTVRLVVLVVEEDSGITGDSSICSSVSGLSRAASSASSGMGSEDSVKSIVSAATAAGSSAAGPFWPPLARPKLRISRALIPRLYNC